MTDVAESRFVYVTYIRTSAEKLWAALTSPDFAEKYWRGARPVAHWKPGGAWKLVFPDGRVGDMGEIVEFEPEKRLASSGATNSSRNSRSLCTMEIEPIGEAVKLTVTHSIERENSKFIGAVSSGWPQILSNLKSMLETGSVVLGPKEFRGLGPFLRTFVTAMKIAAARAATIFIHNGAPQALIGCQAGRVHSATVA